ncbi:MAG: hypothetical protein P4M12_08200 [Gammaproteobacteria bacterium]|nr:hypothetical protein [Gammaproteobacteria bacterium]
MQIVFRAYKKPILLFIFFSFISATLLAPLAISTVAPNSHDLLNHLAYIIQAKDALQEGQFPLREILSDKNGWQYPIFQFYSPSAYTAAGLLFKYLTPENPFDAYKITLWISLLLGAIYMFRLTKWMLQSDAAAILASVAYLTSPYYLIVINHAFDFTEAIALGILPAVLYYNFKAFSVTQTNYVLIPLSMSWYLLMTTHFITFFYSAILIGTLFILRTLQQPKKWKELAFIGLGFFTACLLAMWFLSPIYLVHNYLFVRNTFQYFFALQPPFLGLLSFNANYASPAIGNTHVIQQITPAMGWTILLSVGICLHAVLYRVNHYCDTPQPTDNCDLRMNSWLPILIVLFMLAFFLAWSPFNFWKWLPSAFMLGQYSWRFLGQAIWIGAILSGWAVIIIFKNKLDVRHVVFGTLLIFLMNSTWLPITNFEAKSLTNFFAHPSIVFNPTAYLLNPKENPGLISTVKNFSLDEIVDHSELQLNKNYIIPRSLLNYTVKPNILLTGSTTLKNKTLIIMINGIMIDKYKLAYDKIDWNISLSHLPKEFNNKDLTLQFKINENDTKNIIKVKQLMLTGFYLPSEILNLNSKNCLTKSGSLICNADVLSSTKTIELPVYYYPNLLKVTLNDKSIPYTSMLDNNVAVVAIKPSSDKTNIIKIKFVGIPLANLISTITWWGILLSSIFFLIKFIWKKK